MSHVSACENQNHGDGVHVEGESESPPNRPEITDVVVVVPSAEDEDEDETAMRLCKAWHRRRLQDRWKCKDQGHSHCFKDTTSPIIHIQLTEADLDDWVDRMHDGFATLLKPPESVLHPTSDSRGRAASDTNSIRSTTSRNTITYQRPFRFQRNPSLTDIRSWRNSLSLAGDDASSASSGVPGVGYLSGRAIKWLGRKVLDVLVPLEVRRRVWAMERLIKKLEKVPPDQLQRLFSKKGNSIHRMVDDLLELSSDDYKRKFRERSVVNSSRFRNCLDRTSEDALDDQFWSLSIKTTPLDFLRRGGNSADSLVISLREIILQEWIDASHMDDTISELIMCTCNELLHGDSPASRNEAYNFIIKLHYLPIGKRELRRLGRPGGYLEAVATKIFNEGAEDHGEQASAVRFFAYYANDHPEYQHYVLGPGLLSLVARSKTVLVPAGGEDSQRPSPDWMAVHWLCFALCAVSRQSWAITRLLQLDVCNVLLPFLISHCHSGHSALWVDQWIDQHIVWTLRNLAVDGGDPGRHAVCVWLTAENVDILQKLQEVTWEYNWMAKDVREFTSEVLQEQTD